MKKKAYTFQTEVWLYPGETAQWHFASVPKSDSVRIKETFGRSARGWGSLPVRAKIGKTTWKTSIFPDKRSGTYLLPLALKIRKQEEIIAGDTITITITIVP